jgi:Zn-dependent protease with chaperone function
MNFFEQQDRSKQATKKLLGLFGAAVLVICTCVYFAVMLTINVTPLSSWLFRDYGCVPMATTAHSGELKSVIDSTFLDATTLPGMGKDYGLKGGLGGSRSSGRTSGFGNSKGADRTSGFGNSSGTDRYDNNRYGRDNRSLQYRSSGRSIGPTCRPPLVWWDPKVFCWTFFGTAGAIGGLSSWKINQLKAGGAVIASELGGIRVLPEIATPAEQQLLNVVEEMAIAASMAVPPVYILRDEHGINAFAAGYTINDAVIGVTAGCLDLLSRDELQGVVAHEFSHILNGDMAMNIKLSGMLHGILCLHVTGRVMSDCIWLDRDSNPMAILGILLRIIGFSGFVSGRLIQSAISRQREFLADASAVQFTRNADGIAGALERIGGISSAVHSPYAETASHMFFSPAVSFSWVAGLFDTHPPIEKRIQLVRGAGQKLGTSLIVNGQKVPTIKPIETIGMVGFAGSSSTEIIDELESEAEIHEAPAIGIYATLANVYALLLVGGATWTEHRECRKDQMAYLAQFEEPAVMEQLEDLRKTITGVSTQERLALLEHHLPQLRHTEHVSRLLKCAYGLVEFSPPEQWPLVYLVLHHRLAPQAGTRQEIYQSIGDICQELFAILSTLAHLSFDNPQDIEHGFEAALFRLPNSCVSGVKLGESLSWRDFQRDLAKIACAVPKVKQVVMAAALEMLTSQRRVHADGLDLMRSIAILLDAPVPAILDRIPVIQGVRS